MKLLYHEVLAASCTFNLLGDAANVDKDVGEPITKLFV